jgi:hypothetical protein
LILLKKTVISLKSNRSRRSPQDHLETSTKAAG